MDDKLAKLQSILDIVDTKSNAEEFVQAFDEVLKVFLAMKADNETERANLQSFATTALQTIQDKSSAFTSGLAEQLTSQINEKLASIQDGYTPRKGVDYFDGLPGSTPTEEELTALITPLIPEPLQGSPDSAAQIVDKLEALTGEDRLDASAIKNLPNLIKGETRILASNKPLWALEDVDVSGITTGQSIKWDGTRWIPYTPAGGALTSVYGETPADSGDHTNFTLAHTPAANTLRLYRGGARQIITTDFTLSSATITLLAVLQTGELLTADYDF